MTSYLVYMVIFKCDQNVVEYILIIFASVLVIMFTNKSCKIRTGIMCIQFIGLIVILFWL